MDKLNFLTAGMPLLTNGKGYDKAFDILKDMKLDGLELEFVRGVRISDNSKNIVKSSSMIKTIHAPFYINLNARENEKIEASIQRIIETAEIGQEIGAFSITYHAGFYLGMDKDKVYQTIKKHTQTITDMLSKQHINIWIRPETTGKASQWGDLDEIIQLSKEFEYVLPCVDFSHLHARYGGSHNTYDEFAQIFEKIGTELKDKRPLENFHAHMAGIEYTSKGERQHLIFEEADFNYKDLLKAFKDFDVKGVIVCESPNIESDTKLIRDYYYTLS